MIRAPLAILVVVLCGAGCGGAQKPRPTPAAAGPIADAARRIPARATYALIFARADEAAGALRDVMTPFGAAEQEVSPQAVDGMLRQEFGFSFIDPADLQDQGVDTSRPFALFSTGYFPTLLVPVGDAAKATAAVGKLVGERSALVKEHRGARVTSFTGGERIALAQFDGWVAIHFGADETSLAWLDEILDSGAGADAGWALAQVGERTDAVGWIDTPGLLAVLADGKCEPPSAIGRVALGAALGDGSIDATATVELTPDAAQAVARHTAPPPDAAFLAARAEAAVALSVAIDLRWLGGLARAQRTECGLLDDLITETDLDDLDGIQPGVTSVHAAILTATTAGRDLDLLAMLWLGAGDETAVRTWVDFLFPPDERGHEEIAGIDVATYRLEALPLAEPLRFVLSGGSLRLTSGRGVMERLLGGGASVKPAPTATGELAFFQLLPDAMPDTRPAGELLVISGRMQEEEMRELSLFFASLKRLVLSAALENGALRLAGRFDLR